MLHPSRILAAVACGGLALGAIGPAAWPKSQAVAAQAPRDDPGRAKAESMRHMRMILLALHNYSSANGRFPSVAIADPEGTPLLSWRVAVLPFLEGKEAGDLYGEFHLNEPWDSPHNKALITRMPDVFTTPSDPAGPGSTRIRGFAGLGAMFDGPRGVAIQDVLDGLSNTVMIAAARDAVPWTRPDELAVVMGKPLPVLDGDDKEGALVGAADGSVRYIPGWNRSPVRGLITRAGREVVAWPAAPHIEHVPRPVVASLPTPTAVMPSATPAPTGPAPAIPPELEQRLRGIEDKLDRVLKRLDAPDGGAGKR